MKIYKWMPGMLVVLMSVWLVAAEDTSFLPRNAVGIQTASVPANEVMIMVEQSGFVPYKGHGCVDESTAFNTGPDGKQYGDNEYTRVNLTVMRYKDAFKDMFDQLLQAAHPSMALRQEEENARSGDSDHGGLLLNRAVRRIKVDGGEMLLVADTIRCIESPHESFVQTRFTSYALMGTTQVNITGIYNSARDEVERRIHEETVAAVKNRPLK